MTDYGVALFYTTSAAIRAEKLLKDDYSVKMIPTPRELSSDCGIALRFDWPQHDAVRSVLEAAVEFQSIHRL